MNVTLTLALISCIQLYRAEVARRQDYKEVQGSICGKEECVRFYRSHWPLQHQEERRKSWQQSNISKRKKQDLFTKILIYSSDFSNNHSSTVSKFCSAQQTFPI